MPRFIPLVLFFPACAALAAACYSGGAETSAPPAAGGGTGPTFHHDVEPLLQQHCDTCHVEGGIAPMSLVTFDDAQPFASLIATQTSSRTMPPWGAFSTPDCSPPLPWKNDPTLSSDQIAMLGAWAAAGAPEGNPADAPPPFQPQPVALSGVSADLAPPAAYTLASTTHDEYRCFVLDPKITSTTYLNGSFVVPGNPEVVHHALVFSDPTGASLKAVTDPSTQSYECFGGAGVPQALLLAAWAPGGLPSDYPSNVGAPLDPGTKLVMQVHYHPHTTATSFAPDQTHFQMRLMAQAPQYYALTILPGNYNAPVGANGDGLVGATSFTIPPYVSGFGLTMQFTVPATMRGFQLPPMPVFAVGGHEHYVGTSVEVDVHHVTPDNGAPTDQCLLAIPHWDFSWQRWYPYDAPIDQLPVVRPGDQMTIKCTYDNTTDNPQVVESLQEQGLTAPQTVHLGESTLDEMCLAPTVLLVQAP